MPDLLSVSSFFRGFKGKNQHYHIEIHRNTRRVGSRRMLSYKSARKLFCHWSFSVICPRKKWKDIWSACNLMHFVTTTWLRFGELRVRVYCVHTILVYWKGSLTVMVCLPLKLRCQLRQAYDFLKEIDRQGTLAKIRSWLFQIANRKECLCRVGWVRI